VKLVGIRCPANLMHAWSTRWFAVLPVAPDPTTETKGAKTFPCQVLAVRFLAVVWDVSRSLLVARDPVRIARLLTPLLYRSPACKFRAPVVEGSSPARRLGPTQ
jgi:hypothetical protein